MTQRKRHNYKNLKIWKLGLEIANDTSDLLLTFPNHEKYDLSSQMSRCSISVPSNIAEGSAKTEKGFSHYLDISLGSSFELGTQLLIAKHKNYINQQQLENLEGKVQQIQRMISKFIDTLS
ncbi:four helix bundle protein [Autumnicola edwardsiae]|uniref:Four helix bundle protein n=1 Tax=Autumnicola edwardsiae TaxID=3075594 RepID=A0ABU3CV77_9FLAO|nr:four helix bundle protein [Zunongwangia sp. F297]MDT0649810.1 four helix bundle protein [Zunongwangia sp. F297]